MLSIKVHRYVIYIYSLKTTALVTVSGLFLAKTMKLVEVSAFLVDEHCYCVLFRGTAGLVYCTLRQNLIVEQRSKGLTHSLIFSMNIYCKRAPSPYAERKGMGNETR